ncbi:MAG: helix-turn-helix domain-containing protein [Thermoplasmata archaeon]|nr:MAG: helix-turn-helix domain-containing protein [Thermoplasmata archaeon]
MYSLSTEYPENRISKGEAEETDTLLTAGEAASLLNIHINTVRKWSNLGIIPSLRIGPRNDRRFRKRDLMTFLLK